MRRRAGLGMLLLAASFSAGCVERRFVITSDPPGALVYRNGQAIGTTPVDDSFVYYGKYKFTLVKEGYETLQAEEKASTPWYEYPPLDFFSENIWPFKIRDVHRPHFQLQPLQNARHDDVLNQGTELRARGRTLTPFAPVAQRGRRPAATTPVVTPAPTAVPAVAPAINAPTANSAPAPLPSPSLSAPSAGQ